MSDEQPPSTDRPPDEAAEPTEAPRPCDRAQGQAQQAEEEGRDATAHMEDQLKRALADLENLRKRYHRDLDRARGAERARLATEMLPVVDNLELALRHAEDDATTLIEGVRAVHEQAVATLARLGFPRFDAVGQSFDPALHEAVTTVDDESPPGTVVAVVRPGYGTPGALLRPAGVVVARKKTDG